MLALGWQVFRRHAFDVLDRGRMRRAGLWSAGTAVVAAAAMTVLQARLGWTGTGPASSAVGIALLAVGVGLVVFACLPTRRPPDPSATINGRQVRPTERAAVRAAVEPYLLRRPRPVRPEDREVVRTDTVLLRRSLIGTLRRAAPAVLSVVAAVGALVALGQLRWWYLAWAAVWVGQVSETLVRLGRSERARRAAEAAEAAEPSEPPEAQTAR